MTSQQALLQPVYGELLLNVGDLIERALAIKRAAQKKKFQSFNPSTDNFQFLLQQSGVRDVGRYQQRWTPKTDFEKHGGYSAYSHYQLKGMKGHKPLTTLGVLGQLNVRPNMHATTRELMGLFLNHHAEMVMFLKRKHRLIALGNDMFHQYGAAILILKRRKFLLQDLSCRLTVAWLPSDIFVTRIDPS
ncbi:MAG: hypothetical protein RLZZ67_94 [Candidatus Parcubacteria bacterium]|jgi:hypothetical protein